MALLGLLDREPSHGYDLKRDYDACFGRGRPTEKYLDAQRAAHLRRMRELAELKQRGSFVAPLLADRGLFHSEAEPRWIDLTADRLAALAEEGRAS